MWALIKKDLAVWIRSPAVIAVTILPPLVLMLVLALQAVAVTSVPVALVDEDPGGRASTALMQAAEGFDGFRPQALSAAAAASAFADLRVAAVLTIPPGFSADLAAGRRPALRWEVRNFATDSTNDLRRALPDVVTAFLKSGVAGPDPIGVTIAERDVHPQDASLVAFEMVGMLAMLMLQAGLINAGLAAVKEWETGSVKELLVSPATPLAIIAGKVVAGVIAADVAGVVLTVVTVATGLLPAPSLVGAGIAFAAMTLLATFGAGVGVALAAALRTNDRMSPVSINVSLYLFFLSGGVIALAYLPAWLRAIARVIPNTYAADAFRQSLLYRSTTGAGADLLWLAVAAAVGLLVGIPALRRGLAH
jgi:ABC-2 type transport system permease protein